MRTNDSLIEQIKGFNEKLNRLNLSALNIGGYAGEYLELIIKNSLYYLHIYAHVLQKVLDNTDKDLQELVLVDYGSGNGILGMFAKYCGFKKVYLVDVNTTFVEASKKVSNALQVRVDEYVVGDCATLQQVALANEKPDAIVGTDVIEHIYDLDEFLGCTKQINDKIITVFTTASVTTNIIKNNQLMSLQYDDEWFGSNEKHATTGDEFAGLPFLEIRRRMIQRSFPELAANDVVTIARATRGKMEKDIIDAARRFKETGKTPKPLSHRTNTCDPVTGSWTERLLTVEEYEEIFRNANFSLNVFNGFYNQWQGGIKGFSLKIINRVCTFNKALGKTLAPFITLVAK